MALVLAADEAFGGEADAILWLALHTALVVSSYGGVATVVDEELISDVS